MAQENLFHSPPIFAKKIMDFIDNDGVKKDDLYRCCAFYKFIDENYKVQQSWKVYNLCDLSCSNSAVDKWKYGVIYNQCT